MNPHEGKGARKHPAEHATFLRKLKETLMRPWRHVAKANVYRQGDVGIDVPAGASARDLRPADYRPVEMEKENDRPDGRPAAG
jgi:hypothetical protein